jgi:cold shock CspA family protein
MPKGKIKHARPDLGYGFLTSDEGDLRDVFVHQKACDETGAKLQVGLWYSYDLRDNRKHPGRVEACNLRLLKRAEAEQEKRWVRPEPVAFGQEMPE